MLDFKLSVLAIYVIVIHIFAINGILAWFDYMGW